MGIRFHFVGPNTIARQLLKSINQILHCISFHIPKDQRTHWLRYGEHSYDKLNTAGFDNCAHNESPLAASRPAKNLILSLRHTGPNSRFRTLSSAPNRPFDSTINNTIRYEKSVWGGVGTLTLKLSTIIFFFIFFSFRSKGKRKLEELPVTSIIARTVRKTKIRYITF